MGRSAIIFCPLVQATVAEKSWAGSSPVPGADHHLGQKATPERDPERKRLRRPSPLELRDEAVLRVFGVGVLVEALARFHAQLPPADEVVVEVLRELDGEGVVV